MSEADIDQEERHRLATVGASAPLVALAGPVFLPFFDERSLLEQTRWNWFRLVVVAVGFGWPVLVAAFGLWRARARRAPGTAAFAVPAVLYLLVAAGFTLAVLAALAEHARAREEPGAWIALLASSSMLYVLGRGFRRSGWNRWAQLVAGTWLLQLTYTGLFNADRRGPFGPLTSGAWLFLFGLSAAAPAIAWILWPKRRS